MGVEFISLFLSYLLFLFSLSLSLSLSQLQTSLFVWVRWLFVYFGGRSLASFTPVVTLTRMCSPGGSTWLSSTGCHSNLGSNKTFPFDICVEVWFWFRCRCDVTHQNCARQHDSTAYYGRGSERGSKRGREREGEREREREREREKGDLRGVHISLYLAGGNAASFSPFSSFFLVLRGRCQPSGGTGRLRQRR